MAFKSPWKNAFPPKKIKDDQTFRDIKKPFIPTDSCGIAASSKYIAYPVSSGFAYHKLTDYGRSKFNHMSGRKGKVYDLQFSPFQDDVIAFSNDEDVKVEKLADYDESKEECEEQACLEGHEKNVIHVRWHPTAIGVLASGSADSTVKLWNVGSQTAVTEWDIRQKSAGVVKPFSVEWSKTGDLIAVSTKEKYMLIGDPRLGVDKTVGKMQFEGTKKSHAFWMNNINMIGATCFNKGAKRMVKAWDLRKMDDKPLFDQVLDQQSSVLFPFYDSDTFTLYTVGRGEGNISAYHCSNSGQIFYPKGGYSTNEPQKGGCLIPKRACDVTSHEVARVIKLTDKEVVPVPFKVMLKSTKFKKELFPDTFMGTPSCNADDYFKSEADLSLEWTLGSMDPKKRTEQAAVSMDISGKKSYGDLEKENAELKARIAELEGQLKQSEE